MNYTHKLALISGKGGTAKTTISLCLAKLFGICGIKTLLIDCDIATHGASYFFEERLGKTKSKEVVSLIDLFAYDTIVIEKILKIGTESGGIRKEFDKEFYFVPSGTHFSEDTDAFSDAFDKKNESYFINNITALEGVFDVIIFDCQAGYTDVLRMALKTSTKSLAVLEPDAISAAATRILYAKLAREIEKTYPVQLISKTTEKEYKHYQPGTIGAFTLIQPVIFNFEVRASFNSKDIPDMFGKSLDFGKDILGVAKNLFPFPGFIEQLSTFTRLQLEDEKKLLQTKLKELQSLSLQKSPVFSDNLWQKFLSIITEETKAEIGIQKRIEALEIEVMPKSILKTFSWRRRVEKSWKNVLLSLISALENEIQKIDADLAKIHGLKANN